MPTLDPQSLTRHIDRLYRAAWALCGSREDAEDLVQETFARVLARPRTLRTGGDELAYLMRVLRNTFLTSRRTASRRPQTGAQLDEGIAADERASAQPERMLEAKELYAAVAELSEDFRLALVAVDVLGLSYREAAEALGAREATITTRLFRARRQVARALSAEQEPVGASPRAAEDGPSAAGNTGPRRAESADPLTAESADPDAAGGTNPLTAESADPDAAGGTNPLTTESADPDAAESTGPRRQGNISPPREGPGVRERLAEQGQL